MFSGKAVRDVTIVPAIRELLMNMRVNLIGGVAAVRPHLS